MLRAMQLVSVLWLTGMSWMSLRLTRAETHLASCGTGRFNCGDGRSVPASVRCDWVKDCTNGEDEEHCPACGCDAFNCGDGQCRRKVDVCDGKSDCPNGKDEEGCPSQPSHLFSCGRDDVVILKEAICDGVPDCLHTRADEANCSTCSRDAFLCDGYCWRTTRLCDGMPDCSDGLDEKNCATGVVDLNLKPSGSILSVEAEIFLIVTALVLGGFALGVVTWLVIRRRQGRFPYGSAERSFGSLSVTFSRDLSNADSIIDFHQNDTDFKTAG